LASDPELKLVLDTNIWLDWLVFDDPETHRLRNAVHLGRAQVVMDAACDAELQRVLAYDLGKHSISTHKQAEVLAQARRLSSRVEAASFKGRLPQCRDADDQKFLELAAATGADALVTKDRELLRLRGLPFRVLTPADFR
jgi:uncharacterized protein